MNNTDATGTTTPGELSRTGNRTPQPRPLPAHVLADDLANEYRSPPLTDYYAYSAILRLAAEDTTRVIHEVAE